jgi:hypothetical protein
MILRGITYKKLNLQWYSKFIMSHHKAAAATVLEFIAKEKIIIRESRK